MLIPKDFFVNANAKVQRMGPYEKLKITMPSIEMQNQVFRMMIQKLEEAMPR
jgi:hypothetical protein